MKTIATSLSCLLLMAGLAFGDATLTFNDNGAGGQTATSGSYTPGQSFSFDITLGVTNSGANPLANVDGFSLWMATAAGNSAFKITSNTFPVSSPFSDHNQNLAGGGEFILAGGNNTDLGGTQPLTNPRTPGQPTNQSYFVSTLTIQIDPSVAAGTYTIFSNASGAKTSVANSDTSTTAPLPQTTYTITVVPEPATWSLLGLGGMGSLGLTWLRARRRK
jgi:hypothetical protein